MKTLTLSILLLTATLFAAETRIADSPAHLDDFIKSLDLTQFRLVTMVTVSEDGDKRFNVMVYDSPVTTFSVDLFIYYDYNSGELVNVLSVLSDTRMAAWERQITKTSDHRVGMLRLNYIDFLQEFYPKR